jgi:hypothetical protein
MKIDPWSSLGSSGTPQGAPRCPEGVFGTSNASKKLENYTQSIKNETQMIKNDTQIIKTEQSRNNKKHATSNQQTKT